MTAPGSLRLVIIGGGNMARGLLGGLLARGFDPGHITVAEPDAVARAELARAHRIQVSADNIAAVSGANVVVLAVKPQIMGEVTRALAGALRAGRPLVISVAAGIQLAQLRQWVGAGVPLVRCMPNRPALIGAGATGLYAGDDVDDAGRKLAGELLAATGVALWVDSEADLDLVTALSGSGPAYFFRLAELMAEAAIAAGLAPGVARQLAAQTLSGAGRMVVDPAAADLAAMRAAVTSKGGTTAAALARFDALGLPATVAAAMHAAVVRSQELARQPGD